MNAINEFTYLQPCYCVFHPILKIFLKTLKTCPHFLFQKLLLKHIFQKYYTNQVLYFFYFKSKKKFLKIATKHGHSLLSNTIVRLYSFLCSSKICMQIVILSSSC